MIILKITNTGEIPITILFCCTCVCSGSLSVVGDDNFAANIDFQAAFGSAAIILIVVGLVIACIAFIGWCSNCCGGYNIMRIVVCVNLILAVTIRRQSISVICLNLPVAYLPPRHLGCGPFGIGRCRI